MFKKKKIIVDGEERYFSDMFDELNDNEEVCKNTFRSRVDKKPGHNWTLEELRAKANNEPDRSYQKRREKKLIGKSRKEEALSAPDSLLFWVDHTNFWPVVNHEH